MTMQLPGSDKAAFSLTTPFVPRGGRENLAAFAVVNSQAGPDYGKITVLQLPRTECCYFPKPFLQYLLLSKQEKVQVLQQGM